MNIKWDENKIKALISSIKDSLSISNSGSVSYKGDFEFKVDALFSYVEHKYELDIDILYENFKQAVISTYKNNRLKKHNDILKNFKKICDERLSIKKDYVLLTSISLDKEFKLKRRKINNCVINFYREIPKKYKYSRSQLIEENSSLDLSEQPNYLYVTVSTQAHDETTAFKKGIAALDIIRSLLQMSFQKRVQILEHAPKLKYFSDSAISLGQMHSLHKVSGAKACDTTWYEPDFHYKGPIRVKNHKSTESNITLWLDKIRNSQFSEHLSKSLVNYINALDHTDQEFRFMKLWSVVEVLIKTDDTKLLIKRISFFYADRAYATEVLTSLRNTRNVHVHAGVKPLNVELKNYNLCFYIENILKFLILNPFKCEKFDTILKFISSPTELNTIDQQIENLHMVKKFISYS